MGKSLRVIREKDGVRGLVPSRMHGIRDTVYGAYLAELDPRQNRDVRLGLAASKDPRFLEFLDRISSPRYKRISLQAIAKACAIDLKEFQDWWQNASTQRSIALAQMRSVQVTESMAEDALTTDDVCPRCDGLGFVAAPRGLPITVPGYKMVEEAVGDQESKWIRDCPKCVGRKQVRKIGDTHARNTILEMSGIIQRGRAAVSIVQNFGGAAHSSAISQLDDAMTIDVQAEEV